ncbi:hypothetical protein O9K51_10793 [Purpureocillium lavendulum]|uniref:Uncharacterized protein n=1 Tax=Purpureocillium lavendulum TaxID=1247861 RepID=A0AB34FBD7_9HYPO|nr:hypothetical protein O9K51_10793 [Purpureocillium lavendulum]
MYLGDSDLGEVTRRALDAFDGVTTRDMAPMIDDKDWKVSGWAAKPFAILFSTFREVIFIDADALFFRDPETLFDDPGYKTTGALFFRDRLFMPESKKSWLQQVLPKPVSKQVKRSRPWTGDSGHMQESGVIVVDKVRHFVALLMVTRMNGPDRDGNKDKGRVGIYDMVYGDKETFWLGWELVGDVAYAFHQGDAGTMGVTQGLDSKVGGDGEILQKKEPTFGASKLATYRICSPQLIHLDLDGSPIWFNDWLLENKFVVRNQRALIQAWNRSSYNEDILENAKGCLFLGVPHRGSGLADWANVPAKLLKTLSMGFAGNSNFIKVLRSSSKDSVRLSENFVDRAKTIHFRSFFETDRYGNQIVGILSSFFDELSVVGILLALVSLGQASNLIHTGQVSSAHRFTQWGAWGIAGLLAVLNIVTFGLSEWQYSDDGRFFGPTQLQNLRRITFTMLVVQMAFNAFILIKAIMLAGQTRIEPRLLIATRYLRVCCVLMLVKTCYNVGYYADYVPLGDSETGQKRTLAYIAILDVIFNSWPAFISLIILFVLGAKKQDGSVWSAPDHMQTAEVAGTPLNMHEMPSQQASWGYGYADQTHQPVPQGWHQHQQPASPVMLPAYPRPQELPTQQYTGSYGSQFRHELPAVQYEKGPQIGTTGLPPKGSHEARAVARQTDDAPPQASSEQDNEKK